MKLVSLDIRQIDGVREDNGYAIHDLDLRFNVIEGRNGIGKTTICRAVEQILVEKPASGVRLNSRWEQAGQTWESRISAGRNSWQRGGLDAPSPVDGGRYRPSCVLVRVDQIWGDGDGEIAARFAREMVGGFEVGLVAVGSAPTPRQRNEQRKALATADGDIRNAADAAEKVLAAEGDLPQLKQKRDECKKVAAARGAIEAARDLAERLNEIATLDVQLAEFPDGMDRLDENDDATLARLKEERATCEVQLTRAKAALAAAEQAIRDCALPNDTPIAQEVLGAWEARLSDLHTAELERERLRRELAAAMGSLSAAVRRLAPDRAPAEQFRLDTDAVRRAELCVRERADVDAWIGGLNRAMSALRGDAPPIASDALRRAAEILGGWLAEADPSEGVRTELPLYVILSAIAAAGLVIAAVLRSPWPLVCAALAAVAAGIVAWQRRHDAGPAQRAKQDAQSRFERQSVSPPAGWSRAPVAARLEALIGERSEAKLAEHRAAARMQIRDDLDAAQKVQEQVAKRWCQLKEETGLALAEPENVGSVLVWLMDGIRAWADAAAAVASATRELSAAEAAIAAAIDAFNKWAGAYSPSSESAPDHAAAHARRGDIRDRSHALIEALRERGPASSAITNAEERLAALALELAKFLSDRHVQSEDDFRERFKRLAGWTVLSEQRHDKVTLADAKRRELRDYGELLALAERAVDLGEHTAVMSEIKAKLDGADKAATRAEELSTEIGRIEQRVKDAASSSELAGAIRHREQLTARAEDTMREHVTALAWQFLSEHIRAEQQRLEPEKLREASRLFASFTQGRYELHVASDGRGGSCYQARETTTQIDLSLNQLSGGARIQLLLAARLAYTDGAADLPLFLDEILAHCDPERYDAIVDALIALVRTEGRQVFYLTNQPTDFSRIAKRFVEAGMTAPTRIDLDEIRRNQRAWPPGRDMPVYAVVAVPDPAGASADEYRRQLGEAGCPVAQLNPFAPPGKLDLFYTLVGDLTVVKALRELHVSRVAQWKTCTGDLARVCELDDEHVQQIKAWIALTDRVLDRWKIGRAPLLTESVLRDPASGITEGFQDRAIAIAEEVRWDGRTFMTRIQTTEFRRERLPHFAAKARETLQAFLDDSGYLPDRVPLPAEQIISQACSYGAEIGLPAPRVSAQVDWLLKLLAAACPA